MKKLFFVAAIMVSGTVFTFAQQSPAPAQHTKTTAPAIHQQNAEVKSTAKTTNADAKPVEKGQIKRTSKKTKMQASHNTEAAVKKERMNAASPAQTK